MVPTVTLIYWGITALLVASFIMCLVMGIVLLAMDSGDYRGIILVTISLFSIVLLTIFSELLVYENRSGRQFFGSKRRSILGQVTCSPETRPQNPIEETTASAAATSETLVQLKTTQSITNAAGGDQYSYCPLLKDHIRLLKLDVSKSMSADIRADLVHVSLHSAQTWNYIALSYTWGSSDEFEWITIKDHAMKVRKNVYRILNTLRALDVTFIWIDSICINQYDKTECSAQVARMRFIYAGAGKVVVAPASGASKAADQLTRILSYIQPSLPIDSQLQEVSVALKQDSFQTIVQAFFEDAYWSRIWIVQEFALNHNLQFLIGGTLFPSNKVEKLLNMLQDIQNWPQLLQARAVYDIRQAWQANKPFWLLDILHITKNSQCGNEHDRVFGLLGLSPEAVKYLPEPNYELEITDITLAITRAYIQKTSADIIFVAQSGGRVRTLPTWCPDLFHFDREPPDNRVVQLLHSVNWAATPRQSMDVSFRGRALLTPAAVVGTIRSLGFSWSDSVQSEFPVHDPTWKRQLDSFQLSREIHACFLQTKDSCDYKPRFKFLKSYNGTATLGYSCIKVFTRTYGSEVGESCANGYLTRWICRNRRFFTGSLFMEQHAKILKHPFLIHGLDAWQSQYRKSHQSDSPGVWDWFEKRVRMGMRLMGLDKMSSWQIGWACTDARLGDEVFLIPGCSRPSVLRKMESGEYRLIGDAIVSGAMHGKLWEQVKAEDLRHITII